MRGLTATFNRLLRGGECDKKNDENGQDTVVRAAILIQFS